MAIDEWLSQLSDSELEAQVAMVLETMRVLRDDAGNGVSKEMRGAGAVWLLLQGQELLLEKIFVEQRRRGLVS